jgi:bacterioferritin
VSIGERVAEQLKLDQALELDAIKRLNKTIALCSEAGDHGTRDILEPILHSEEEHLEWLETQLNLIKQVGEAQYLAQQIHAS